MALHSGADVMTTSATRKIIRKEPERAARLDEIFIAACHEKADEIDDSSGNFGMLVEEDRMTKTFKPIFTLTSKLTSRGEKL